MKQTTKRALSLVLGVVLLLSLLPVSGIAALTDASVDKDGWGPDSMAIVGSGLPGIPEWDPADPAGDMTQVSDNVYEIVLSCVEGTTLKFKIAGNDMWDDDWNFGGYSYNDGVTLGQQKGLYCGSGSCDMVLEITETDDYRFAVDLNPMIDGGDATLLVTKASQSAKPTEPTDPTAPSTRPTEPLEPDENGNIRLYCKHRDSGIKFYAYWWFDGYSDLIWPGVPMLLDDNGLWYCDVPADAVGVQFHNDGSYQSGSLTVPTVNTVVYDFTDNRWLTYQEAVEELYDKYYVAGNAELCGVAWDMDSRENQMTKEPDGTFSITYTGVPAGKHQFQVTAGTWSETWGDKYGSNVQFTVYRYGSTVSVFFDPITKEVRVSVENPGSAEPVVPPIQTEAIFGDANALHLGQSLPYEVTLTGQVTAVDLAYSETRGSISVKLNVDGYRLNCYGLTGEGIETLKVGDTVTVMGRIGYYISGNMYEMFRGAAVSFGSATDLRNLYVIAPSSWEEVYAYTWEPAYFGDFPGVVMKNAGAGVHSTSIKDTTVYLLFSSWRADGTRQQTTDIKLELNGLDVVVTIQEDGRYTVRYLQQTTGTYRVVGNADFMGSWYEASDAGLMTEIAPGLYLRSFQSVEPGSYEFKITKDGSWDAFIDDHGQNYCFTVTQWCDVTVTLAMEDSAAPGVTVSGAYVAFSGGSVTPGPDEPTYPDGVTLYCQPPTDWSQCYIYTWSWEPSLTEFHGAWPGTLMTPDENGMWSYQVPAGADYVIFNCGLSGGGSAYQTDDLYMPTDDRVKYVVDAQVWVEKDCFDYPNKPTTPDEILEAANALKDGERLPWQVSLTGQVIAVDVTDYDTTVVILVEGTAFTLWNLYNDGYRYRVGDTVTVSGYIGNSQEILYINDPALTQVQEGTRTLTVFAPASWTGVDAYTWDPENLGGFPGAAMEATGEGYRLVIQNSMVNLLLSGLKASGSRQYCSEILLERNGLDVVVRIAEDGSCQVSYASDAEPGFRVVGNAPWMGSWDPASDEGLMTETSPGVYQITYTDLAPGTYEFRVTEDGAWVNSWGLGSGNYFFWVNDSTFDLTVTFTYRDGQGDISVRIDIRNLMGDVSGDGRLNMGDVAKLYSHVRNTNLLTDDEALARADFNGDGRVNIGDVARIYAHIRGA